jgi:biotin carboxylase
MSFNKKKLLIAGGGYADIPLILAAKQLGFYVITSGNRSNDLGHRYSDECHLEDFSNKEAMLQLARSLKIDAICSACNDFSALTAAYIAENLELPGHDSYETSIMIHHKDKYREFAQKHCILSPRAEGFSSLHLALERLTSFKLPVLVKPVDLTGGKGISKINTVEESQYKLEAAFQASRAKRIVVEEFIEGSRHGLSTFIRDGRVVFCFSDDEHYYANPYLVSGASTPGTVTQKVIKTLCQSAEQIALLLRLKTGIFHIQYILKGNKPIIIEICRRAPGDLYTKFVEYATGIEYSKFIVRSSAGMSCVNLTHVRPRGYFMRHCMMASSNGKISKIEIAPSIRKNILHKFALRTEGDDIHDFLIDKIGIVFLQFDSMQEMLEKTENIHDLLHISTI